MARTSEQQSVWNKRQRDARSRHRKIMKWFRIWGPCGVVPGGIDRINGKSGR